MNEQKKFINLRWVGTKQIVVFYTKYTIEVFELKIQDLIDTLRIVKMSNMKSYYMYKYTEKPHQRGGGSSIKCVRTTCFCLYISNLGTFWLKIEQFWPFEEISISSNGGHLGYETALTDIILKGDHLRIIQTKFG
jgi:hypothetical protein